MEKHLLDGSWAPGMRLPAERLLSETLQVSRSSVREAIARLKARGLLATRQGSGVFVTDLLQQTVASPWQQLLVDHPDVRWDTLEFRRELEGATAQYAAMRASKTDLMMIGAIVDRLNAAYDNHDKPGEYRADADFHEAVSIASHNSMFRHLHAGILRMLREHISLNLQELHEMSGDMTEALRQQHNAIWDAIRDGKPDVARKEMLAHIDFTWTELARMKIVTPSPL
jgi:GntR family transcriptional repressor for pyruvate dehydrogenase complex